MTGSAPDLAAGQALALIIRGDVEQGLALYREALKGDHLPAAPVGMHLRILEGAGRSDAAARLLDLAVKRGANVAARAGGFGADPGEAAAEYESLFERGIANSRMVHEYLLVLEQLGRWDELRAMLDFERLLRITHIARPEAGQIEALLLELEAEAPLESDQSIRNMRYLNKLSDRDHPLVHALIAAIGDEVAGYLRDWRSSPHPLAGLIPDQFEISAWGLISRGEGYNVPHIHHRGWATGVYYPTAVGAGGGGELRIGKPERATGSDVQWGTCTVRPEAGMLVLIPSFVTHWTEPLGRPGLRTSIAFDLLPLGRLPYG